MSELIGRKVCEPFEVFTKEANGRKIELICYLYDGAVTVFEHHFGRGNQRTVYPFLARLPAYGFYNRTEIAVGKAHFLGIESHSVLLFAVIVHQINEAFEDISIVGMFRSSLFDNRKMKIILIDNRANYAFNDLLAMFRLQNRFMEKSEKALNEAAFGGRK